MQWQTVAKSFVVALSAGSLLLGCGGPEAAPQASTPDTRVRAMAPPTSCDPWNEPGWCLVSTRKVTCWDGLQMDTYNTPDGYCIQANVCERHGGPIICPEY
jgi:hypothetical protein